MEKAYYKKETFIYLFLDKLDKLNNHNWLMDFFTAPDDKKKSMLT